VTPPLKSDLVWIIAETIGVDPPRMSTGSTVPKEIFLLVNDSLGLGLDPRMTKPEMAKSIVELSGCAWPATAESRGGTVTADGLRAVLRAVQFFTGVPIKAQETNLLE